MRTRERSRRLMPTYKAHRTPNCIHLFTCQKISHPPSPHATRHTYVPQYVSRRTADMVARIECNSEWCARCECGSFWGTECALHPIIKSIALSASTEHSRTVALCTLCTRRFMLGYNMQHRRSASNIEYFLLQFTFFLSLSSV